MTLEKKILSTNDWGLVAMLHEGLLERFEKSIEAIKNEDYDQLSILINKCRDILTELLITFQEKDELSTNLREMYIYINKIITEGEIKKDFSLLEEAKKVIIPLYEAFKELELKEEPNIVTGLTYGKGNLEEHSTKSGKVFQG